MNNKRKHTLEELKKQKFSMLRVLDTQGEVLSSQERLICECDCGKIKVVSKWSLLRGKSKSCGCLMGNYPRKTKSAMSVIPEYLYNTYYGVRDRCKIEGRMNPNYNGRGLDMCSDWLDEKTGIFAFYNWSVTNGYEEKLSIERINVHKGYYPENCEWIPRNKQSQNTRSTYKVRIDGFDFPLGVAAKKYASVDAVTVKHRIRHGWNILSALVAPPFFSLQDITPEILSFYMLRQGIKMGAELVSLPDNCKDKTKDLLKDMVVKDLSWDREMSQNPKSILTPDLQRFFNRVYKGLETRTHYSPGMGSEDLSFQ